ncbi:MAG: hypothetical protein IPJ86_03620 [Bacteroidetes bacterium]|nr:hypothetical protein [Bacteroidota bacterium]
MKREEKDEPFHPSLLCFTGTNIRNTNPRIHECPNPRMYECPNMTNGVQCREFAKVELKE